MRACLLFRFNPLERQSCQYEPISNERTRFTRAHDINHAQISLVSSQGFRLIDIDLSPTTDNDRKRTRSPLITESFIDNPSTDPDSQSEILNLNRAQNKKSRK